MSQQYRNPEAAGKLPPLARPAGRRDFLKWTGASALAVVVGACDEATRTVVEVAEPPEIFPSVTLDFKDDIGVLNYIYLVEQLETAFYLAVVDDIPTPTPYSAGDLDILQHLRGHQIAHREFLKATLGANAIVEITPNFTSVNLSSRTSVLQAAQVLEELGVAAYNGAVPFLSSEESLISLGKMVSVEGRHAATIRDLLSPTGFAPASFDPGVAPAEVLAALDPYIRNSVSLINVPA